MSIKIYLTILINNDITPRDIVTRESIRNALIVSMAVGGSTNVMLHAPELARAAGYSNFSNDIMSADEFNYLSEHIVPVVVNARPFGRFSMKSDIRVKRSIWSASIFSFCSFISSSEQ